MKFWSWVCRWSYRLHQHAYKITIKILKTSDPKAYKTYKACELMKDEKIVLCYTCQGRGRGCNMCGKSGRQILLGGVARIPFCYGNKCP